MRVFYSRDLFYSSTFNPEQRYWHRDLLTDPRQTTGVGDFISFAVLVHRSEETKPFIVRLDLEATVDWKYWVADKWRSILDQKKTRYLPLRFSNEIAKYLPDGIDVNRLGDVGQGLRKFGFVHVPEKLAPETFYQDGKSPLKASANTILTSTFWQNDTNVTFGLRNQSQISDFTTRWRNKTGKSYSFHFITVRSERGETLFHVKGADHRIFRSLEFAPCLAIR